MPVLKLQGVALAIRSCAVREEETISSQPVSLGIGVSWPRLGAARSPLRAAPFFPERAVQG